jgi:hypothetical protein
LIQEGNRMPEAERPMLTPMFTIPIERQDDRIGHPAETPGDEEDECAGGRNDPSVAHG